MKKPNIISAADRMEKAIRKLLRGCVLNPDPKNMVISFPTEAELQELRRAADKYEEVRKDL